jgi:hypothetical protein
VEDTTILEVLNLDISIKSNLSIKANSSISGNSNDFIDLEITLVDINTERFFSSKFYIN